MIGDGTVNRTVPIFCAQPLRLRALSMAARVVCSCGSMYHLVIDMSQYRPECAKVHGSVWAPRAVRQVCRNV